MDCPGYQYQGLGTSVPPSIPLLTVWRDYNHRAGCEEVIQQLDGDFALPQVCAGNAASYSRFFNPTGWTRIRRKMHCLPMPNRCCIKDSPQPFLLGCVE